MEPLTSMPDAIASAKALEKTVERCKGRDKTLDRLQTGLQDLSGHPSLTVLKGLVRSM
jgi:hypothetical protein